MIRAAHTHHTQQWRANLTSVLFCFYALTTQAQSQSSQSLGQASFSFDDGQLVASTGTIERRWAWTGKGFRTTSFKNLTTGREWATSQSNHACDWSLPTKAYESGPAELLGIECVASHDEGFTDEHLLITARIAYDEGLLVNYLIRIYPKADGLWTALAIKALDTYASEGVPADMSTRRSYGSRQPVKIARCESIPIDFSTKNKRHYWGLYNDPGNRVNTKDMVRQETKIGWPLFQDEQTAWANGVCVEIDGETLTVVKESNKTVNKYGHQTGAFYATPTGLEVTGWGLLPTEITTTGFRQTWATWSILSADGEDGMELALKRFDRRRYPVNLDTDMHILVDTWGSDWQNGEDDRIYGRENSAFEVIHKEIKSASDLGIDIVRIDDGWQSGGTFAPAGKWHPNPEVGYAPNWEKTKKIARDNDVRIGLWAAVRFISPQELLTNQHELGVATWKFDFDKLHNWEDFHHRHQSIRSFLKQANARTQTSWCPEYDDPRYGWYSPMRECGPMYFQNLQNNLPNHLAYVPYITLRHHWMMAKYYNMVDLQCNWANPARTNPAYSDAPQHSQSYAAMSAFVGSPASFMLTQLLKPQERDELRRTIGIYKKHRKEIYEAYALPIGDEPSNDAWTGFQLYHPNKQTGHLIVFREHHNLDTSEQFTLKFLKNRTLRITDLAHSDGQWTTQTDASGAITLTIPSAPDYRFLKYEVLDTNN